MTPAQYNEDSIKTLASLAHIRARPGMYIGRLGNGSNSNDGIYVLLKEIIDNAIDEFIMGNGRRINITTEESKIIVRDFGRGIPLGKIIDCVSIINTGGKFNDNVFQFSVGMNGVGTKAVNALSKLFIVESIRDGNFKRVYFEEGVLQKEESGQTEEVNGTQITFIPSNEIFGDYKFLTEHIEKRLWRYAHLNAGLSLYFNNTRYYSKEGLKDLVEMEIKQDKLYEIIHYKDKTLEFAFSHSTEYGENYYSFVNGQYTNDGGTHQSAFKEGLLRGISEYTNRSIDSQDVREGVIGAIAIKIKDPVFESQTKNKLTNTDIRSWIVQTVKDEIADFLHRNKLIADVLVEKINQNERVRKEISAVKKSAKEVSKKMSLKIPKLKDCKYHLNTEYRKIEDNEKARNTMIFLTEGDSAAGSMIPCRDVWTQAVFPLRGKIKNAFKIEKSKEHRNIEALYKNEELFYVMQALGIEDGIDNLRYNKVVIATDADDDGMHIRNLLITFFLTFFEQLVRSGHLYIFETPLFRVRNKKQVIYCYDEKEQKEALKKLGKTAEITRFKGLGEISPKEFGQFLGENIRLINITIDHMHGIPEMLEFYMGENTPARRSYIMENLV